MPCPWITWISLPILIWLHCSWLPNLIPLRQDTALWVTCTAVWRGYILSEVKKCRTWTISTGHLSMFQTCLRPWWSEVFFTAKLAGSLTLWRIWEGSKIWLQGTKTRKWSMDWCKRSKPKFANKSTPRHKLSIRTPNTQSNSLDKSENPHNSKPSWSKLNPALCSNQNLWPFSTSNSSTMKYLSRLNCGTVFTNNCLTVNFLARGKYSRWWSRRKEKKLKNKKKNYHRRQFGLLNDWFSRKWRKWRRFLDVLALMLWALSINKFLFFLSLKQTNLSWTLHYIKIYNLSLNPKSIHDLSNPIINQHPLETSPQKPHPPHIQHCHQQISPCQLTFKSFLIDISQIHPFKLAKIVGSFRCYSPYCINNIIFEEIVHHGQYLR